MNKKFFFQLTTVLVLIGSAILIGCGGSTSTSPTPGAPTNTPTTTATSTTCMSGGNTCTFTFTGTPTDTATVTATRTATKTPTNTSTATPTPAATTGAIGTTAYTNPNITINAGQSVQWNTSNIGHPLNIDDSSGTCIVSNQTSFPYTHVFLSTGTYHFHCGKHSTCGNGTCPNPSTCAGMVGTITVN